MQNVWGDLLSCNWEWACTISFGMSSIRPTFPLRRRTISLMLAHFSPVPCWLGFKMTRMPVEWLYSSSALRLGLNFPPSIYFSRVEMDSDHMHKVVWTFAKRTSPKRIPSVLSRTKKGMEAGDCITARASSNDQPDIWKETEKWI